SGLRLAKDDERILAELQPALAADDQRGGRPFERLDGVAVLDRRSHARRSPGHGVRRAVLDVANDLREDRDAPCRRADGAFRPGGRSAGRFTRVEDVAVELDEARSLGEYDAEGREKDEREDGDEPEGEHHLRPAHEDGFQPSADHPHTPPSTDWLPEGKLR